jgi:hypothetical protein
MKYSRLQPETVAEDLPSSHLKVKKRNPLKEEN